VADDIAARPSELFHRALDSIAPDVGAVGLWRIAWDARSERVVVKKLAYVRAGVVASESGAALRHALTDDTPPARRPL